MTKRSEIFDAYAEIAIKKGLISTAEETNPRYGSDDVSTIEALYGVKPNKETVSIMEEAHPNSVIIAPSYDKINALVETNHERQNIIINLIGRNPTGMLTHKKLAEQELTMELIRVANHLDNIGDAELMTLADLCIEGIEKKKSEGLKKEALLPLLIVVGVIMAGVYLQQHSGFNTAGTEAKINFAIQKLSELQDDSSVWRDKIDQQTKTMITKIIKSLAELRGDFNDFQRLIDAMQAPMSEDDLKVQAEKPDVQKSAGAIKNYHEKISRLIAYLTEPSNGVIPHLLSTDFRKQHTLEGGLGSSILGPITDALHGTEWYNIFSNKWFAAAESLKDLADFLTKQLAILDQANQTGDYYKQRLQANQSAKNEFESSVAGNKPGSPDGKPRVHQLIDDAPEPTAPEVATDVESSSGQDFEGDTIDFSKL